ncbi:hypothetical protein ADUPG1_007403 [Aduncisulcus paluster]|nr:hypothetical protein ADUPG1_007403 [Aduncisulcus paluster]
MEEDNVTNIYSIHTPSLRPKYATCTGEEEEEVGDDDSVSMDDPKPVYKKRREIQGRSRTSPLVKKRDKVLQQETESFQEEQDSPLAGTDKVLKDAEAFLRRIRQYQLKFDFDYL